MLARRFVFCRQRWDERLKRGGEQKSVAVLSAHPFSSVLGPLSQHAGPLYFNHGVSALQTVPQLSWMVSCPLPSSFSSHDSVASKWVQATKGTALSCWMFRRLAATSMPCAAASGPAAHEQLIAKASCIPVQVYEEVQQWGPPSAGRRAMVLLGGVTLPAQVPAAATLPAPPDQAPGEDSSLEHPLQPLPVVRQPGGAETVQGAFFEARLLPDSHCFSLCSTPAEQLL